MRGCAIRPLAVPVVLVILAEAVSGLLGLGGQVAHAVAATVHTVLIVVRNVLIGSGGGIAVAGVGVVLWRHSFPHRATVVMGKLPGVPKDDRPRLRRIRRLHHGWELAWRMPLGLTTSKLMQHKEAIEERLDCAATFWYRRGLVWMQAGTAKLPDLVTFEEFYRPAPRRRFLFWRRLEGAPAGELVFGVGMGRFGRVWADLARLPHLLVGGLTGGGKSVFLQQTLVSMIERYAPEHVKFALTDLKSGVEFQFLKAMREYLWGPIATIPEAAEDQVQRLNEEMDRRQVALEAAGVQNVKQWNEKRPDEAWARLVAVVDETAELAAAEAPSKEERDRRQRIHAGLSRLCRLGRAAGVHVILCTQRPDRDAVPGQTKANIPATVAFRVRARVNSEILLSETNYAAAALPPWEGRAIWQWDVETQVQVPLLERDEAVIRLAARSPKFGVVDCQGPAQEEAA